jgi:hypothetical protein
MKLFQIEEPEGSPLESDRPGVAVGIELSAAKGAAVAVAVGGNAELLPGGDGAARLALGDAASLAMLLLALRERAEKTLARPVTHAVIALDGCTAETRAALPAAVTAAGLAALRIVEAGAVAALAKGAKAVDAAVLGAAVQAEDDAASLQPR